MRISSKVAERIGVADDAAVQRELLQERASTLERLGRRLEEALRALRAFDAAHAADPAAAGSAARREQLLAAAGDALWYYVVQREVCGLGSAESLIDELGVPREVQLRMGVRAP